MESSWFIRISHGGLVFLLMLSALMLHKHNYWQGEFYSMYFNDKKQHRAEKTT